MNIRQPVRADSFYEGSPSSCRHHADKLLAAVQLGEALADTLYGGLVPHAGWMYSGRLAARTFKTLDASSPLRTLVLLGADHTGSVQQGEVYEAGVWRTPLGEVEVDQELAAKLLAACDLLRANPQAHQNEHSIEVQVPLIQYLCPDARVVPISVPPADMAVEIGAAIGRVLAEAGEGVFVVGSTDLTHHAGHFPAPGGHGAKGVEWTVKNDRRFLDLVEQLAAEQIIPEAAAHANACGAGAVAATIAACREMGATRGVCLEYTNSYEVMHAIYPSDPDDTTVGYASVIFS